MKNALAAICVAHFACASVGHAALIITEVASTSGAPAGPLEGLDWWELTNTGPGSASLNGYSWEDEPVSNDRAVFPNGITLAPGESIIIHQGAAATVAADFRTAWGLSNSVQVLTNMQFTGPNPFSGLGAGGDAVNLFDAANALVDNAMFGASTSGVTFEWSRANGDLGLSVNGQNGAFLSNYGGVGSPGTSVVPEPMTLALTSVGIVAVLRRRR
jgi:hypothetical protein